MSVFRRKTYHVLENYCKDVAKAIAKKGFLLPPPIKPEIYNDQYLREFEEAKPAMWYLFRRITQTPHCPRCNGVLYQFIISKSEIKKLIGKKSIKKPKQNFIICKDCGYLDYLCKEGLGLKRRKVLNILDKGKENEIC